MSTSHVLQISEEHMQTNLHKGGEFSGTRNGAHVDKFHPALAGRTMIFSKDLPGDQRRTGELITKQDEKLGPKMVS